LTEAVIDDTRLIIKNLYATDKGDEVAIRTMLVYKLGLVSGKNLGEITVKIIDLGVKPPEMTAGLLMMIDDWPKEDLNERDKEVQKFCQAMNKEIVNQ